MANLTNKQVADLLLEFARRSKPQAANSFSYRAYLRAAESLRETPTAVGELILSNRLWKLPGVGHKIAGTITKLYATGTHPALENMRAHSSRTLGQRSE